MLANSIFQANKAADILRLLCAASLLIMLIIGITAYGAPAGQLLIAALFFIFYVQLPGLLIVRWSGLADNNGSAESGFHRAHFSTCLASAVFSGWALCVIVYFIAELTGVKALLLIAGPLLSLAYIYLTALRRDGASAPDAPCAQLNRSGGRRIGLAGSFRLGRLQPSLCVFIVIVLLYCLITTQYRYLAPELCEWVYVNPDKAYHMGLINSLSHGYPLRSPWVHGRILHYHIFTELLMSVPVSFFGVRADVMTQSFGPWLTAYTFSTAFYSFFREMSGKPGRAGLYCLIFPLSYMYAARRMTSSFAFKIIFTNDNFAGYGLAAMLVFIVVFGKWWSAFSSGEGHQWRLLALCTMLIMLITGIKGPVGAVVTAGLWGTVALGIILRRLPPGALLPLLVITAGFAFVYVTLLAAKGQVNAPGGATISLAGITNISFWKKPFISFLKSHGVPGLIRLALMLIAFTASFFTVYFVPLCIGYVRELALVLYGKKGFLPAKVLVYAVTAAGFMAMMLLSYSGHSQIYFGLTAVVTAPAIAYWFIEDLEDRKEASPAAKMLLQLTVAVMALSLIVTGATLGAYFMRKTAEAAEHTDPAKKHGKYMSMSSEEFEAMRWIDANTEKDSMLANDRYYSVAPEKFSPDNRWNSRFFLYEVYSNRLSYISGSGFDLAKEDVPLRREMIENNKKLYDPDFDGRGELARGPGIDYVIVSKRFTGEPELENTDYEKVFTNEDIDIYKILQDVQKGETE